MVDVLVVTTVVGFGELFDACVARATGAALTMASKSACLSVAAWVRASITSRGVVRHMIVPAPKTSPVPTALTSVVDAAYTALTSCSVRPS